MPTCMLLLLDQWDLSGVKGTALGAIRVCAGIKLEFSIGIKYDLSKV